MTCLKGKTCAPRRSHEYSVLRARCPRIRSGRQLVGNELGGIAVEANHDELPEGLRGLDGPIPPLGLFGLRLALDEHVASSAVMVFRAFGENDYFELTLDDLAREQPRVASFALAGELPRPKEQAVPAH
jgi:hypothetical protein